MDEVTKKIRQDRGRKHLCLDCGKVPKGEDHECEENYDIIVKDDIKNNEDTPIIDVPVDDNIETVKVDVVILQATEEPDGFLIRDGESVIVQTDTEFEDDCNVILFPSLQIKGLVCYPPFNYKDKLAFRVVNYGVEIHLSKGLDIGYITN